MKRLLVMVAIMVSAAWAHASGVLREDDEGHPMQGHSPTAFYLYSSTKAGITHSTATANSVAYRASADCTVKVNGTGAAWLVKANEKEQYFVAPTVTSLVFTPTSSATKTKIYVSH